jgi:hypothetical protein
MTETQCNATQLQKCQRCNRKLNPFKNTIDWKKRKLHKSCWKLEQEELSLKILIQQVEMEYGLKSHGSVL